MDITPYIETLRNELTTATDTGDEVTTAAGQRLIMAIESATRLTLMEAFSDAAAEISRSLPSTAAIELRLQGREPVFVLTGVLPSQFELSPEIEPPPSDDEGDGSVARITLRLPETLKLRAEDLAVRRGQSLNSWLVDAARQAANTPEPTGLKADGSTHRRNTPGRHFRGWVK